MKYEKTELYLGIFPLQQEGAPTHDNKKNALTTPSNIALITLLQPIIVPMNDPSVIGSSKIIFPLQNINCQAPNITKISQMVSDTLNNFHFFLKLFLNFTEHF